MITIDQINIAVEKEEKARMLESKIEEAVCKYAKDKGLLVYKFISPNRRSVPDRMFIHPSGKVFFIEFKRTGEVATMLQEREHARLREHKMTVYVVDSIDYGIAAIDGIDLACRKVQ